jgi:DNA polymerase elongation subunit (family B)
VQSLLDKSIDTSDLVESNIGMAANGHCFSNDRIGFFPDILMRMYEDRKLYKSKMINAQKELEKVKEELNKRGIKKY